MLRKIETGNSQKKNHTKSTYSHLVNNPDTDVTQYEHRQSESLYNLWSVHRQVQGANKSKAEITLCGRTDTRQNCIM